MKSLSKKLALGVLLLAALSAKSQWNLGGNALTGSEWIGSSNAYDLIFKTNNTQRMFLSSGGSLVIGTMTTTPTEKLHLPGGNIMMDYWGTGGNLYFGGKTNSGANGMRFSYVNGSNGYFDVRTSAGSGLVFRIDGGIGSTERFRINQDGNVGLNISSPLAKFHMNGSALFSNIAGNPTSAACIRGNSAYSTATTPDYTFWNNDQVGMFHPGSNMLAFSVSGAEKMRIHSNGNIGIHTLNPTADLTVNGSVLVGDPATLTMPSGYKLYVQTGILTEKVKVAVAGSADWADYVFAKEYKLKTLDEVEKYILTNAHLPGVPSSEEAVKDGIDLGKMDAKLLEKIEELTLYMIEQNKKLKELEMKNEELAKKLNEFGEKK